VRAEATRAGGTYGGHLLTTTTTRPAQCCDVPCCRSLTEGPHLSNSHVVRWTTTSSALPANATHQATQQLLVTAKMADRGVWREPKGSTPHLMGGLSFRGRIRTQVQYNESILCASSQIKYQLDQTFIHNTPTSHTHTACSKAETLPQSTKNDSCRLPITVK